MKEPKLIPNRENLEGGALCRHLFETDVLGLTGRCLCGAHMNMHTHEVTEAPAWRPGPGPEYLRADDTIKLVAGGTEVLRVLTKYSNADVWNVLIKIHNELDRATKKYGSFHSKHEGYAVLKEQVDELWDSIKDKHVTDKERYNEAMRVAAMAVKYMLCFKP